MSKIAAGRTFVVTLLAIAASAGAADAAKFVVHEWGVSIRQGGANPALGPANELVTGLPPFVLRHDGAYVPKRQDHGWDKPVVYFYGPDGLEVKVSVGTPQGTPLAYWPRPDAFMEQFGPVVMDRKAMMAYSLTRAIGMHWSGVLTRAPVRQVGAVDARHWFTAARAVPAMYFNGAERAERFLFYEATATQDPPVSAEVTADVLVLRNGERDAGSGPVVVIVNDGRTLWGRAVADVPARGEMRLAKADLVAKPWPREELLAACRAQWRAFGMTEPESRAIVDTWERDLVARVGFLVIARMPDRLYERMFPMTIAPRPDELVRVGLVFDTVPGADARAAWLPGLNDSLRQLGAELGAEEYARRQAAASRFMELGDLARPFLRELQKSPDPEVAATARGLIERMEAKPPPQNEPTPVR